MSTNAIARELALGRPPTWGLGGSDHTSHRGPQHGCRSERYYYDELLDEANHRATNPPGDEHLALNVEALQVPRSNATSSRAEAAAKYLEALADRSEPDSRLGRKEDLRKLCGVSVGTFNEALKLAQSRGIVAVRPGPGGGIFVSRQSPFVRMGNSVLALDTAQTSVADAVRIRNALDPLLVEDALLHASPTDIAAMRVDLDQMRDGMNDGDAIRFVRANWHLHAEIARTSPNAILRSIYLSLLNLVEEHTLEIQETEDEPLPEFIASRFELHVALVDAIAARDKTRALQLIEIHNTSGPAVGIEGEAGPYLY